MGSPAGCQSKLGCGGPWELQHLQLAAWSGSVHEYALAPATRIAQEPLRPSSHGVGFREHQGRSSMPKTGMRGPLPPKLPPSPWAAFHTGL